MNKTVAPKQIVDDWDGPLCLEDRFFYGLEDAVEWCYENLLFDNENDEEANILNVPEFIDCCDTHPPRSNYADYIVETIAEDTYNGDDHNGFDQYVTEKDLARLDKFLAAWVKSIGWNLIVPNGKCLKLRECVIEYAKED